MHVLRKLLLAGFGVLGCALWIGCGESNEPVMVKPDVPPAVANKASINDYLKSHPEAAKRAGKDMVPGK